MVSFSCEGCGDVLTKKKLDPHRNQCRGASYTCIDCMTDFYGTDYRAHTSCMSEAQKYQGALYRPEKDKKGKGKNNQNNNNQKAVVAKKAYVEDVPDNYSQPVITVVQDETLPEAPDPPSAVPSYETKVPQTNVFDYLEVSETPKQLLSKDPGADGIPSRIYEDDQAKGMIVQYSNSANGLETPAPRRKDRLREDGGKKDKKRKRLHVDTSPAPADETMIDLPSSTLHTGLTGGLNRLLSRPDGFPPSPDYSGGNVVNSPASPLKRSKRERAHTTSSKSKARDVNEGGSRSLGDTLLGMLTGGPQKKSSSRERDGTEARPKKSKHTSNSRPSSSNQDSRIVRYSESKALATYDPTTAKKNASLFLDVVVKGADSEKGYSLNKALRRYHREKENDGGDEKELFKSLRLKKNDRGEVVVFIGE